MGLFVPKTAKYKNFTKKSSLDFSEILYDGRYSKGSGSGCFFTF